MDAISNCANGLGPEIWAAVGGALVWLAGFARKKAAELKEKKSGGADES